MLPTCRPSISFAAACAPFRSNPTFTRPSLNREPRASWALTTSVLFSSQSWASPSFPSSSAEETTTTLGTTMPHLFKSPIPGPSSTLAITDVSLGEYLPAEAHEDYLRWQGGQKNELRSPAKRRIVLPHPAGHGSPALL